MKKTENKGERTEKTNINANLPMISFMLFFLSLSCHSKKTKFEQKFLNLSKIMRMSVYTIDHIMNTTRKKYRVFFIAVAMSKILAINTVLT